MGSKVVKKLIAPLAKPLGKAINAIPGGNIIASIIATATGNPELIPLIIGTSTYAKTGNVGAGLLSAGGSYLGGKLGGEFFGNAGTAGGALTSNLGNTAGNTVLNGLADLGGSLGGDAGSIFSNLAGANLGAAAGSYAGNSIGEQLGSQFQAPKDLTGFQSFKPTRSSSSELPGSLSSFGSLDPQQQATNIANKGVFGGGLGPQEEDYFTNLVNRQLVDDSGKVGEVSSLAPIEGSYLNQLGLGGYSNTNDLLEAISKRKRA